MEYSQPDFYRFNQDSIFLANKIIEFEEVKLSGKKVLDLCCGCGVIGMELMKTIPIELIGVDINEDFKVHFDKNKERFFQDDKKNNISFILSKLSEFVETNSQIGKFDFIVSNPPYFKQSVGRKSNNAEKHLCRFLEIDSFSEILELVKNTLNEQGVWWCSFTDQEDKSIYEQNLAQKYFKMTHEFRSSGTIVRRFELKTCEVE